MAHNDGPAYEPVVATVSTGSGTMLRLLDGERTQVARLYLAKGFSHTLIWAHRKKVRDRNPGSRTPCTEHPHGLGIP